MYTALLHTHKLVVFLFVLHYLIKTALLLLNKQEMLARYARPTRIPEMVLSLLFLITGGWMLVKSGSVTDMMLVKLICVFSSIPLAVLGFKKQNKAMAGLAFVLLVTSYGLAEMSRVQRGKAAVEVEVDKDNPLMAGKQIYDSSCSSCHGADGNLGLSGAKPLSASTLSDEEKKALIQNGKNSMPAFVSLSEPQLDAVVKYINSMRTE